MNNIITINNKPEYAKDYEFIVARYIGGEYWFYGAYSDGFKADEVAREIGDAVIFHDVRIQGKKK